MSLVKILILARSMQEVYNSWFGHFQVDQTGLQGGLGELEGTHDQQPLTPTDGLPYKKSRIHV
jgi:hypothetical protein